jgi:hypothetical protein
LIAEPATFKTSRFLRAKTLSSHYPTGYLCRTLLDGTWVARSAERRIEQLRARTSSNGFDRMDDAEKLLRINDP